MEKQSCQSKPSVFGESLGQSHSSGRKKMFAICQFRLKYLDGLAEELHGIVFRFLWRTDSDDITDWEKKSDPVFADKLL